MSIIGGIVWGKESRVIYENLPIANDSILKTDADLMRHDKESLVAHNEQYTRLLEAYVEDVRNTLNFKYVKKKGLYNVAISLFVSVPIATLAVMLGCLFITVLCKDVGVIDVLPEIITAFGLLIATYIAVVKLITAYIFNKDEDKTMEHIISQIQDYDMHLRHQDERER